MWTQIRQSVTCLRGWQRRLAIVSLFLRRKPRLPTLARGACAPLADASQLGRLCDSRSDRVQLLPDRPAPTLHAARRADSNASMPPHWVAAPSPTAGFGGWLRCSSVVGRRLLLASGLGERLAGTSNPSDDLWWPNSQPCLPTDTKATATPYGPTVVWPQVGLHT